MENDLLDSGAHALTCARQAGATSACALVLATTDMNAGMRHGAPETIERAESRGLGLRVFVGQSMATLSSSDLSHASLAKLAQAAVAIARVAPADTYAGLADVAQLATAIRPVDMGDSHEPSMQQLQETAKICEESGRDQVGITNSEGADASFSRQHFALVTSHGFAQHYTSTRHSISCVLIAGQGSSMQRDYDYRTTAHHADLPDAATLGRSAAQRTLARMHPRKIASQQTTVFFDPRCARQLIAAFSSAISGAAIARGTSFLKNDLGKKIFADAIQILDDPLLPRGLGSRPFDAEGIAAEKTSFVTNGVLTSWMLDCRNARQLGMHTTGHAARGLTSAPYPASSNLYMAAGDMTRDALLNSTDSGLLVMETIGHGVNLLTGDYSVGATGFWVERGQITYPVSEVTIAGNLRDMFAQMVAANDLHFHYATNAPTLMVPAMTIAGS